MATRKTSTRRLSFPRGKRTGDARSNVAIVLRAVLEVAQPRTAAQIADTTGLSKSTVQRSLVALESEGLVAGRGVESHAQTQVYEPLTVAPRPDAMPVANALVLLLAMRGAPGTWGSLFGEDADALTALLARTQGAKWSAFLDTAAKLVVPGTRGRVLYRDEHREMLETFLDAAGRGCAVRARYRSPFQTRATRLHVAPARLFPNDGAIYLVLDDVARPEKEPRVFALHRFENVELDPKTKVTPNAKRADERLAVSGDVWIDGDRKDVTLRVRREWASFFAERQWFPDQRVRRQRDGDLLVETTYVEPFILYSFVMSHMPWVSIEEPAALRKSMRAAVRKMGL